MFRNQKMRYGVTVVWSESSHKFKWYAPYAFIFSMQIVFFYGYLWMQIWYKKSNFVFDTSLSRIEEFLVNASHNVIYLEEENFTLSFFLAPLW